MTKQRSANKRNAVKNNSLIIALAIMVFSTAQAREWKSSDGTRTFDGQLVEYRPPNVTVYRKDGQRITFSENLLSAQDRRYCALASRVLSSSYPKIPYQVIQVLDYGLICIELQQGNRYYSGETLFIWGDFRDTIAENDVFRHDIYWAGSYSYTNVEGVDRTIRSFTGSLDDAVAIWEYRLAPPDANKRGDRSPKLTKESLSSSGTGFAVSGAGHIVTNAHVIEGAKSIQVRIGDKMTEAKVIATDTPNDLAILKVTAETTPLRISDTTTPKLGDEITVGGFPNPDIQGTSLKLTRGVISGMKGIRDDIRHFQIDAAVQPGNSGGPLLSATGDVVGVVNARLNDSAVALATGALPQNVNYAIKVDYLLPLLRSVDGFTEALKNSTFSTSVTVGERLQQSTYFIQCDLKP